MIRKKHCKGTLLAMFCAIIINSPTLFAESVPSEKEIEADWILAASEFTATEDSLSDLQKLVPQLILSNITVPTIRKVGSVELFAREVAKLDGEYTELVSSYIAKIEVRDALVVTSKEDDDYKNTLKNAEEAILEAKQALSQNTLQKNELAIQNFVETPEKLALYKDDVSSLFSMPNKGEPTAINALITGNIQLIGDYYQASVQLTLYPGAKRVYDKKFTFNVTEVKNYTVKIAKELLPIIQNEPPVVVTINMDPQEVLALTEIRVDGNLVALDANNAVIVSRNRHQLSFNCDGYATAQARVDFSQEDSYIVKINLRKIKTNEIELSSSIPLESLNINGIEFDPKETVFVNSLPAIGQAVVSPNTATYIIITEGRSQFIKPNTVVISDYIEKRRRTMYNSYGVLLLSLPFSFVSYGMYIDANYSAFEYGTANGYDIIYIDLVEKQDNLKIISNVTKGVSIGIGVYVVYQFVRYILAVNKILPQKTKTSKSTDE